MKPKFLRISGLNSFIEEQEIDFAKLTEKGLFGIFGPTGSGKSTILDAITIALYDHIPRSTKEYINTDCEKLYVSYEFEIGGAEGRKSYRIERSKKRNNTGGINTDFARLCVSNNNGEEESVFDRVSDIDEEIRNIIGLNHSDFTRSVVLPQGKFSDFLKLTGKDRNKMLERILSLEKYGKRLYDKIKSNKDSNTVELKIVKEKLTGYEGVSQEGLKGLENTLIEFIATKEKLEKDLAGLKKKYEDLSKIWGLQQELKSYIELNKKYEVKEIIIEEKRRVLDLGVRSNNVKPYIESLDHTLKNIDSNSLILKEIVKSIEELQAEVLVLEGKYKEAYERKEEEVPLLIEKETKLKVVIELLDELAAMVEESKALAQKEIEIGKLIDEKTIELEDIKNNRIKINEAISNNTYEIKNLKITSEFRNSITKVWESERKYSEILTLRDKMEATHKELSGVINESSLRLEALEKGLQGKEGNLKEYNITINELENKKPKSREEIIQDKHELEKKEASLSEFIDHRNKANDLDKEIGEKNIKISEVSLKLDNYIKEFTQLTKEKNEISQSVSELEKQHRASILSSELIDGSACPVCGSHEHPNPVVDIDLELIENKRIELKELEKTLETIQTSKNKTELELKLETNELERKNQELEIYSDKLKDINIDEEKNNIVSAQRKIEDNEKHLIKWEKEYEEARTKIDSIKEEMGSINTLIATKSEGIKKDKSRLSEIAKEYSELNTKSEELLAKITVEKHNLGIIDIEQKIKEIERNDIRLEKLEGDTEKSREELKGLDTKKDIIDQNLRDYIIEKNRLIQLSQDKKMKIEDNRRKISKEVGERNPREVLEETLNRKNEILKAEEKLKASIEENKNKLNKLYEDRSGKANIISSLEKSLERIEVDLEAYLKENKFNSIDEARAGFRSKEELNSMKIEVDKYDDEIKRITDNIKRLNDDLKGDSIEEEEWNSCRKEIENKNITYNELLEELGTLKEKISEMKKDLTKVKEFSKEVKALEHRADMLKDMFNLVSGSKFVEFAAIRHLKYIAKEASVRLMDITSNRYSLELDNSGNFIICDNYNGGVRRDCNTLSGGETFLTSLALALALSTQIQLKGKTSVEFFFLDEGFGTLDNHLLDTVITSLEKLHEEKLSVGIISHVEDLKNRMPTRLIVSPSESGLYGTRVKIENS